MQASNPRKVNDTMPAEDARPLATLRSFRRQGRSEMRSVDILATVFELTETTLLLDADHDATRTESTPRPSRPQHRQGGASSESFAVYNDELALRTAAHSRHGRPCPAESLEDRDTSAGRRPHGGAASRP